MENESNFQEYYTLFQKELSEIEELDDPIEVYLRYIGWLFENYEKQQLRKILLPILEQATEHFKEDLRYTNDPRYFNLWFLYSKHIADPETVFSQLLRMQVSTGLAAFYEEYATLLTKKERVEDAGVVFEQGILRKAMPFARLERRFKEFQRTTGYQSTQKSKREEKLAADLDLFYSQNEELCFEEMRAKLSKYKSSTSTAKSSRPSERFLNSKSAEAAGQKIQPEKAFNESSTKKKSVPSPTINTKAALADILEIFNQPLKCEQFDSDDDAYDDDEYSPIQLATEKKSEVSNYAQNRPLYDENRHPSYSDENNNKGNPSSRVPFAPKVHADEKPAAQPKKSFSVFQDSYEMPLGDSLQQNLNHSYSEKPVSNSKQFDLFRSRKSLPNLQGNRTPLRGEDSPTEACRDTPHGSADRFTYSQQENEQIAKLPEKAFMVYQDENSNPGSKKVGRAFDVFCDDNYTEPNPKGEAKPFSMLNNPRPKPAQEHSLFSVHKPSLSSQQKTPQHPGRSSSDEFEGFDSRDQRRQFYINNPPGSSLLNKFANFLSDGSDGENESRESIYRQ
ncbi:hypothetical protein K493DRAFT_336328 [Basidiobolus meristosporus CBS 931.73]|uniref:BUB1 N-terminal domain-containing protein n=1 Tax=Basidiobolus meristosporus CBS 931.73 TaxID=1314790 RepID=A0A1Y1XW44_9FUNG|nr:hypothetical protein K493DRAFT_318293 [Basidiobolus meristosporus CBS 931.73]ORX97994.1 hypothetical protein K493DRAFT_336328 [Basidiobolus meristosporus CBS 931.73]|eukprot:ORX89967.1 hypothetical protein K493DRAFT_318293 [Basidiobolus meristosporus CBS 931.73]